MSWSAADAVARASAALGPLALHLTRGMGERVGDRRFPGRPQATGIEVEAHRGYVAGDDLRHLDWNAAGRLGLLVTRRFTAEREVAVDLLVDASASMEVPARDAKLDVARELATALAWMALGGNDAVRVVWLAGGEAPQASRVHRRRGSALALAAALAGARAGGTLDLAAALDHYARRHRAPGVAIVVSDFMMEPATVEAGVLALRARRKEVVLLQVIGRGELDPTRDVDRGVLRDVESGATHPIALTPAVRARYDALLAEHLAALAALADRLRVGYARLVTGEDVAGFVATELARLGLVRRR